MVRAENNAKTFQTNNLSKAKPARNLTPLAHSRDFVCTSYVISEIPDSKLRSGIPFQNMNQAENFPANQHALSLSLSLSRHPVLFSKFRPQIMGQGN